MKLEKEEIFNIEISEKILNYIITGLEFYCIMLNHSIYVLDMDLDMKDEQYADCFYSYHYLMSYSKNYRSKIRLQKPSSNYREDKILYFTKQYKENVK